MWNRRTFTQHDVITVFNDMFDLTDGVMRGVSKTKTPWKEDFFLAVK